MKKKKEFTEHDMRVYYQNMVYEICDIIDYHLGHVPFGEIIQCGSVEAPSRELPDALKALLLSYYKPKPRKQNERRLKA